MAVCEQILVDALKTVNDPELNKDLISLRMVRDIKCNDNGEVSLTIVLTTPACPLKEEIEKDVRRALMKVRGVKKVTVNMTSETSAAKQSSAAKKDGQGATAGPGAEKIKNVVGVASGKGGVGKSTISVNLAVALAQLGAKVGLLDADFYGPNVPFMMGLSGAQPEIVQRDLGEGKTLDMIVPIESFGVKVVSLAFFVQPDEPVAWRGPILHNALNQFFNQVDWGELDYLVVDMPPGTGDVQIDLIQSTRLTGVVHVTTPQSVSILDVSKCVSLFKEQKIPQLGVIENMSYFISPASREKSYIFGQDGGRNVAEKFGIPFLGEVPLEMEVRQAGDAGKPVVADRPESEPAKTFIKIACQLAGAISIVNNLQNRSDCDHDCGGNDKA